VAKKPSVTFPERPREYADDPEQPYWPTFIEKFLLTIIDANPAGNGSGEIRAASMDRQRRLDEALHALLQIPPRRGNKPIYQLHALIAAADAEVPRASMAAFEDYLGLPSADRTATMSKRKALAANADRTVVHSPDATLQRLQRHERVARDYISQIALFRSHDEEEDMLRDLRAIEANMSKWNIALSIDVEALGMASLWGRNPR
jgi:hypothetical protein